MRETASRELVGRAGEGVPDAGLFEHQLVQFTIIGDGYPYDGAFDRMEYFKKCVAKR